MKKLLIFFVILIVLFVSTYIICINFIHPYEIKVKEAALKINNTPSTDITKLLVENDGKIEKATQYTFNGEDEISNSNSILKYNGVEINNYQELKEALGENYVGDDIALEYFDKENNEIIYISDRDYALGGNLVVHNMTFPVRNEYRSLPIVLLGFIDGFTDPFGTVVAEANIDDEVALLTRVRLAPSTTATIAIILLLLPFVVSIVWHNKKVIIISLIIYSFLGIFKIMNWWMLGMM